MLENKETDKETNATPMLSHGRRNALLSRFGHVPVRAAEIIEKGCAVYWKTDRRMVNQGTCFYSQSSDTYYVKSKFTRYSHESGRGSAIKDEMNPKDISWMEVERSDAIRNDNRYIK